MAVRVWDHGRYSVHHRLLGAYLLLGFWAHE